MSNSSGRVVVAGLVGLLAALAACGKGDQSAAPPAKADAAAAPSEPSGTPTEADMAKQAEETRRTLAEAHGGKDVKAVEAKDLKAALPEAIGGTKRAGAESQHINQGGIDIATMKASYEPAPAEGDTPPKPGFDVEILDLGNLSGTMAMGYAAWSMMQFERETESGYEKTLKYKGFPAMEKYDRESKNGELHVFVAKRFVVQVSGHDAKIEDIRAAMDAMDLGKIEALAK